MRDSCAEARAQILTAESPLSQVFLIQQVFVKMLEYVFEKAVSCAITDMVQGDERSVVNGASCTTVALYRCRLAPLSP